MTKTYKRKFGDRKDGRYLKNINPLNRIFMNLMPNRTDAEVYLHDVIDATELVKFIEKKNAEHPDYKTTVFHCFVTAIARMVKERPELNRFIQGHKMYERFGISISFVAKRRFADGAEESLMVIDAKNEDTLDEISHRIYGDVSQMRKTGRVVGGADDTVDAFAKIPPLLLMGVVRLVRYLDFWGICPASITKGDPNFTTVLCSNLGSIQCPAVYHHLNNYGTNSIMVTVGTLHKEEIVMPDGHKEIRDVVDIGCTVDERIADGFYFARSLKLIKHVFAHPELLDLPLGEPSDFDYK